MYLFKKFVDPSSAADSLRTAWHDVSRTLGRQFRERGQLHSFLFSVLAMVCITIGMGIFAACTDGVFPLFLRFIPVVFSAVAVLLGAATVLRASPVYSCGICIITLFGFLTQCFLACQQGETGELRDFVIFMGVGVAAGILALPALLVIIRLPRKKAVLLVMTALVIAYLILCVFGRTVNGTRAWVRLGPISVQVTDLCVLLSILGFGLFLTWSELSAGARLRGAYLILGIDGIFLFSVNELGSLIVVFLVFAFLIFGYYPNLKMLLGISLGIVLLASLVLLGCFLFFRAEFPEEASTFWPQTETVQEQTAETEPANQTDGEDSVSHSLPAKIFYKIYERIGYILDSEKFDPYETGFYQIFKAKQGVSLSGWAGSEYAVTIPAAANDFAFTFLLMKMGFLTGALLILIISAMLVETVPLCLACPNPAEGATGAAFVLQFTVQAGISAASAVALIPTVGIPFPAVSQGGTFAVMTYTMAVFVFWCSGQGKKFVESSTRSSIKH